MNKARVPDYLPNKPTLVGSGNSSESVPKGYFNKGPLGSGISNTGANLPVLSNPNIHSVA